MLVLNKKSKIFLYIIIFVLLVLGGFAVEHFEKDAFVMETVATEDYIPYESDTKEVTDGKININSADTEQLVKLKGIGEKMSEDVYKRQVEYDNIFSFIYSRREGTPAAKLDFVLTDEEIHENFNKLLEVQNEISTRPTYASFLRFEISFCTSKRCV